MYTFPMTSVSRDAVFDVKRSNVKVTELTGLYIVSRNLMLN